MDLIVNVINVKVKFVGWLGRNVIGLFFFINDDVLINKIYKKGMLCLFYIELDKNLKGDDF